LSTVTLRIPLALFSTAPYVSLPMATWSTGILQAIVLVEVARMVCKVFVATKKLLSVMVRLTVISISAKVSPVLVLSLKVGLVKSPTTSSSSPTQEKLQR